MKQTFKLMCSKSSKTKSAVLQCMNLMSEVPIVFDENRADLPQQKRTKDMTGLETGAGHKERGAKRSDLTCEDMKENMTRMVTLKHRRAVEEAMDETWNDLCRAAKASKAEKDAAAEAASGAGPSGAAMDTDS